jgi:ubiquinone/menaquinone biosynthesis C-methylase UbiE
MPEDPTHQEKAIGKLLARIEHDRPELSALAPERRINEYLYRAFGVLGGPGILGAPTRWIEARRIAVTAAALPKTEAPVLEIGVGSGQVLAAVNSGQRIGVDISAAALGMARQKLNRPGDILSQCSATRLPFRDGAFTKVICTQVLEHVFDEQALLDEIRRVAAPSATILFSVPNDPLIGRVGRVLRSIPIARKLIPDSPKKRGQEFHLRSFTAESFAELLQTRFQVRKIRKLPFSFLPLRFFAVCEA